MLKPIPTNKGLYQNVDATELPGPEYAAILKNLLLNDVGSNVDRPALNAFGTLGSIICPGLYFFKNYLLAVTNSRRLYVIQSNGTVTDVTGTDGPLASTARPVFANDGRFVAIAGGGLPQRWNPGASLHVGDIRWYAEAPGPGGTAITIAYTAGATAGAEVVTVVGNAISVQIENNVSTATQVLAAVQASVAASALVYGSILGTAATAQVIFAALPLVFPGTCEFMPGNIPATKFISYLDGYWMIQQLDSQEIDYIGPTAALRELFNDGNFFEAESRPDNAASQYVLFRDFWVLGTDSIEIWQNMGETSVPFRRSFVFDRGIIAPYSVVQADNTLWFLDSTRRFVQMQGTTPVLVSSPFDRTVKGFTTVSDCWGANLEIEGFYLILWVFPTEKKSYAYDYKKQEWSEWNRFHNGSEAFLPAASYAYAKDWNQHFVGGAFDANVFELSREFKADGADPFVRTRESGSIDHGTGMRKRSNHYLVHVKRGLGTPGQTEPVFEMQVNDDNGGWTDPVQIGLGFPGDPEAPIKVPIRGIYRKRKIRWSMSAAVEFVLNKLEEDVEVMTS